MDFEQSTPDAARQMLARFGTRIRRTELYPDGVIDLAESQVANNDLRHLVFFPGVSELNVRLTSISDGGMEFIGQMHNLESLDLEDTLISDASLQHLHDLPKLEKLRLGCAPG